jgi:hypothetical protein
VGNILEEGRTNHPMGLPARPGQARMITMIDAPSWISPSTAIAGSARPFAHELFRTIFGYDEKEFRAICDHSA